MTNAVATRQEQQTNVMAMTEGATLLSVISRAAADPQTDVEKMERLMVMYERLEAKKAETEFNNAMSRAQTEMRPVAANADNSQTRSKYATHGKLDAALRPIYTGEGFALSFDTAADRKAESVTVLCYVTHKDGHTRTYQVEMPADGKGAKGGDVMTKTHATGAAMSYGMRYLLKMIFNVAIGEDDTDGNMPPEKPVKAINTDQLGKLMVLIGKAGLTAELFCKRIGRNVLHDLPANEFDIAMNTLERYIEKQNGAAK